ncbi:MAG: cellulose synthase operon protein YhjQ/BcsQ [Terracidiphilus sp.]|jgi:cellulose synthase operon protein YhjQ
MTEFNPQSDQSATPEDVATLYSWANLHGAKYRDFSAARAQTREKTRLRAEQALEEEHRHEQEEAQSGNERSNEEEAYLAAIKARQVDQARQAELAIETAARQAERKSQLAAEQAAQDAAEKTARLEAEQAARLAAQAAAELAQRQAAQRAQEERAQEERVQEERAQQLRVQEQQAQEQRAQEQRAQEQRVQEQRAQQHAAQLAAEQAAEQAALAAAAQLAQQRAAWQQLQQQFEPQPQPLSRPDRFSAAPAEQPPHNPPQPQSFAGYGPPQAYRPDAPNASQSQPGQPHPNQPQYGPPREQRPLAESPMPSSPWATPAVREPAVRPAWLSTEAAEAPAPLAPVFSLPQTPSSFPQAPEDTLQGSRDRLTTRWFALRGVFEGAAPQPEAIPAPVVSRAPALAVFSLAGGVGKTSLVATLGRALSARGERVLLVDTAAFGLLPFFFGATDQRPGLLRTFTPPGVSNDAPIQMVTIDPEGLGQDTPESLSGEISKFARGASRVIVDLATASGATTRRIMRMSPLVLVPVIPDMNSVVSVSSIDAFFEHNSNPAGKPAMPFYLLNQFDASLPLHLDVREVLREQLGERLLPFALRRLPAMSEALAEGMTVMDYAPGSPLAEDFTTLAGWVKSLSAPATTSYRGVRWSER